MEDLKKNVKELEQKLDTNVELILSNMRKLHKHDEQIQANSLKIKDNSYALEILRDIKRDKNIIFKFALTFLIGWIVTALILIAVIFIWVL